MAAELLRTLLSLAIVSSVAILLVLALRKPLRAWAGARAAYWLWLLAPILALASLVPLPTQTLQASSQSLPGQLGSILSVVQETALPADAPSLAVGLLALWLVGAAAMFLLMFARQRSFSRSLGAPVEEGSGVHRSAAVLAPMLVGAWKPRIIVPLDFETRYSPAERELVLAHEQAHLRRHDVAGNALASASLCVFWFNPLFYLALGWMRADQELACDAEVLMRRRDATHIYANALLKTQLATESAWRMPVGCQWQSTHPLKERIAMLKRPLPRKRRHFAGIASVIVLATSGGYVAWAGQGAISPKGSPVLVTIKVTVTDPRTNELFVAATQYVVHSGEVPEGMLDNRPLAFVCKPTLSDDPRAAKMWKQTHAEILALAPDADVSDMVSIECELWEAGKRAFTPSAVIKDGQQVVLEYGGPLVEDARSRRYRMEVTATTSEKAIEAARVAAENR